MGDHQINLPIDRKFALNIKEAAVYFGVGEKKLRSLMAEHSELFIQNGVKVLVKRRKFEDFLTSVTAI